MFGQPIQPPPALSDRQQRILDFIDLHIKTYGYPPTIREIGEAAEIPSTSVVNYNLKRLEQWGYVQREPNRSRGLRLTDPQNPLPPPNMLINVPLLRRIPMSPVSPIPNTGMSQQVPGHWLNDEPLDTIYAVRMDSVSMVDALVFIGDVLVVKRQTHAEYGDKVLVILPDDKWRVRLRAYYPTHNHIRLDVILSVFQSQTYAPEEVQIVGKVIGMLREF